MNWNRHEQLCAKEKYTNKAEVKEYDEYNIYHFYTKRDIYVPKHR